MTPNECTAHAIASHLGHHGREDLAKIHAVAPAKLADALTEINGGLMMIGFLLGRDCIRSDSKGFISITDTGEDVIQALKEDQ